MSHPPKWAVGQSYAVGDLVTHEGVEYIVETAHISSLLNEPDAVTDTTWQPYWTSTTPTWGDFLYGRIPAWLRTLDAQHQNSLYRFLRIFGRSMNITQGEVWDFILLKDIDLCPAIYLDNYSNTLGMLLPHAVDEASQRRLLATIVALYRRKGTKHSLEYIATRYLGLTVTILVEDWAGHFYVAEFDDTGLLPAEVDTMRAELARILTLYEPAGLIHVIRAASDPLEEGTLNIAGYLNVSFTLNVIYS